MVAREPAFDRHVPQLVQRDQGGGERELAVDEMQQVLAGRSARLDDPAHHPRGVAQGVIGGGDVRVEHGRTGLGGDEQPGVARLVTGDQQQTEPGPLQQQRALPAGTAGEAEDRDAEHHPQRAVAEAHLRVGRPPHQQEDDVDADRDAHRDEPLPPGEHHHGQRQTGVEQRSRVRREDQLAGLVGERSREAVVARGALQRDEEPEGPHPRHGPQRHPRPTEDGRQDAVVSSPAYSCWYGVHVVDLFIRKWQWVGIWDVYCR